MLIQKTGIPTVAILAFSFMLFACASAQADQTSQVQAVVITSNNPVSDDSTAVTQKPLENSRQRSDTLQGAWDANVNSLTPAQRIQAEKDRLAGRIAEVEARNARRSFIFTEPYTGQSNIECDGREFQLPPKLPFAAPNDQELS